METIRLNGVTYFVDFLGLIVVNYQTKEKTSFKDLKGRLKRIVFKYFY